MRFEGISDLASVSGPFASIFFPKLGTKTPWICLVFKGTTPDNFAEFLVDASINKVSPPPPPLLLLLLLLLLLV